MFKDEMPNVRGDQRRVHAPESTVVRVRGVRGQGGRVFESLCRGAARAGGSAAMGAGGGNSSWALDSEAVAD